MPQSVGYGYSLFGRLVARVEASHARGLLRIRLPAMAGCVNQTFPDKIPSSLISEPCPVSTSFESHILDKTQDVQVVIVSCNF